jgi:transposase-like protein/predicted site-specific integrase-resolvase
LTKTPTIPVSSDDLGLLTQQVLQTWLLYQSTPKIDLPLPVAPVRALFRVVSGIQSVVSLIGDKWAYYHRLPVDDADLAVPLQQEIASYCAFATAFKALMDWPIGFYNFLDYLRKWNNPSDAPITLYKEFGVFIQTWLGRYWLHEDVRFIQDAFDRYLIERYPPSLSLIQSQRYHDSLWLAEHLPYVSIPEAQSILEVGPSSVRKCVDAGRLRIFGSHNYADQTVVFLLKEDVLALKALRENVLSVEEVSKILGITADAVMNLIKDGILPGLWGGTIAMNYGWYVTRKDVQYLLESLASNARKGRFVASKCHTLHQVCHALGFLNLNMSKVVRTLINGGIPCYRDEPTDKTLSSIWLYKSDVKTFIDRFAEDSGWLSRAKVQKRLGVHESTLKSWVDAGFFTPKMVARNQYFQTSEVQAFVSNYVNSDGAAEILKVGRLTVQNWTRQGILIAVSGPGVNRSHYYLFERAYLESWISSRVPFNEAKRILGGVTTYRLQKWIEEGRIALLGDTDGKHRYFGREEINRFGKELGLDLTEVSTHQFQQTQPESLPQLNATLECPHCYATERQIRQGYNTLGNRRYKCEVCNRKYTLKPDRNGYSIQFRQRAIQMHMEGLECTSIAEQLGVHYRTVLGWINRHKAEG